MILDIRSLLLVVSLLLFSSSSSAMPEPTVVYLFDEGSGAVATDFTGHGDDGTIVGALWNTDTPFPSSCNFSLEFHNALGAYAPADAYVVIPDGPALRPDSALTIEARIKAFDSNGRHIVAKQLGDGLEDSYVIWFENDGTLGFVMCNSGGGCPRTSTPIPSLNVWHHVAAVWDGNSLQTYIDGQPAGSAPFTGPPGYDSNPVLIGADDNNVDDVPDEGWNGLIDEVAIYHVALTPDEVLERSTTSIHDCTSASVAEGWTSTRLNITGIHPNPTSGIAEIGFHTPVAGPARIVIYDCRGREVNCLVDGFASAGEHAISWNGTTDGAKPVASGVYIVRLEAAGRTTAGKVFYMR